MTDIEHHTIRLMQDAEELAKTDPAAFRRYVQRLLNIEFTYSAVVNANLIASEAA